MGSSVNKDVPAYVKVRGNPAKPFGINVTGIKRAGFPKESIEALRSAYRTIYRKKLTKFRSYFIRFTKNAKFIS